VTRARNLLFLLLLVAFEAPGFPESRAVPSPPSPFSSIHSSHATARRDRRLFRLPHLLSRHPSPPFHSLSFNPLLVLSTRSHPHPSIASSPEAPTTQNTQPPSFPSPRPSPGAFSSIPPRPDRPVALLPSPSRPPLHFPGATWLGSKVEPVTSCPDLPRCQSHCAPTASLVHI
jgi:hypothetical protein